MRGKGSDPHPFVRGLRRGWCEEIDGPERDGIVRRQIGRQWNNKLAGVRVHGDAGDPISEQALGDVRKELDPRGAWIGKEAVGRFLYNQEIIGQHGTPCPEEGGREEKVQEALRILKSRNKIRNEPVWVSIPGQGTYNRTISLPPVEKKRIKKPRASPGVGSALREVNR